MHRQMLSINHLFLSYFLSHSFFFLLFKFFLQNIGALYIYFLFDLNVWKAGEEKKKYKSHNFQQATISLPPAHPNENKNTYANNKCKFQFLTPRKSIFSKLACNYTESRIQAHTKETWGKHNLYKTIKRSIFGIITMLQHSFKTA